MKKFISEIMGLNLPNKLTLLRVALMPVYLRAPNAERNRRLMEAQHAE